MEVAQTLLQVCRRVHSPPGRSLRVLFHPNLAVAIVVIPWVVWAADAALLVHFAWPRPKKSNRAQNARNTRWGANPWSMVHGIGACSSRKSETQHPFSLQASHNQDDYLQFKNLSNLSWRIPIPSPECTHLSGGLRSRRGREPSGCRRRARRPRACALAIIGFGALKVVQVRARTVHRP